MTLSVSISQQAEEQLKSKAAAAGLDLETYVARHLELVASRARSFRDITAEVATVFAATGMTEDELATLLEEEKHSMRRDHQAAKGE